MNKMVNISLEGKSVVDACLDILAGKYASLMEHRGEDDRELQMSACLLLGQEAPAGDQKAIDGLLRKLRDDRPVNEYRDDKQFASGSDFYVSACAAESLVILGYGASPMDVYQRAKQEGRMPLSTEENTNRRDGWFPKILRVVPEEDCLEF